MDIPEDIGGDGAEAHGLCHFQAGVPVLARDAGVVEFAGEDFEGLAVEGEMVAFDGEGVRWGGCPRGLGRSCKDGESCQGEDACEDGVDGWFHGR